MKNKVQVSYLNLLLSSILSHIFVFIGIGVTYNDSVYTNISYREN